MFQPVQLAPLNVERIVYIDIGTAHSVAVTGQKTSFTLFTVQCAVFGLILGPAHRL